MPFRAFQWVGNQLQLGAADPDPELRQVNAREFVLLHGFCYRLEDPGDPEDGTVYVIPGEDAPDRDPLPKQTQTTEAPPHTVVVPATLTGGTTDLASVPWFMWWLIASYGNHTRAALLHDALYPDKGETAAVSRAKADRLFLEALREPEAQKPGVFRHWLMWAAVSLFGNMGVLLGLLCALHVLAVWALSLAAAEKRWGPSLWHWVSWPWWVKLIVFGAVIVLLFAIFLIGLGGSWRSGVDLTGGWLIPTGILTLVLALLLWATGCWLVAVALALMLLGPLWGLFVDPKLRMWLWPTSVIGLPISLLPVGLIFIAVLLVWCIDLGAMVAAAARRTRPFKVPPIRPYRLPP